MSLGVWVSILTAAFTIVPGALVARRLGLTWPVAVAAGSPLGYAIIGVTGIVYGALGIPFRLWSAAAAVLVVWLLAWVFDRRVGQRLARGEAALDPLRWTGLAALAAGIATAAATIMIVGFGYVVRSTWGGVDNINGVWDAGWHAALIQWIHEVGDASPFHVGTLSNPDNYRASYYPNAWHSVAALIRDALPSSTSAQIYNAFAPASTAFVIPISAAAIAYIALRPRLRPNVAALSAGVAAGVAGLFHSLPFVELSSTSVPNAVGLALAPVATILVTRAPADRRYGLPAALACIGTTAVHPSGFVLTGLFVVVWWLTYALIWPARGRVADLVTLAVVGLLAALGSAPMIYGALSTTSGDGGLSGFGKINGRADSFAEALGRAAFQGTDVLAPTWPYYRLLLPALVGLVVIVAIRRSWWLLAAWGVVVVMCANSVRRMNNPVGDALHFAGQFFYNSAHRFSFILAMFSAAAVGIGVCAVLWVVKLGIVWMIDSGRGRTADSPGSAGRPGWMWRATAVVIAFGLVAGVAYGAHSQYPRNGRLLSFMRGANLVGAEDLKAYRWLAEQPGIEDTLIFNNADHGTGWMYATVGLRPMFVWYRPNPWSEQQKKLYWNVGKIGADPAVDAVVRDLKIRYIIDSPPSYWFWQNGPPRTEQGANGPFPAGDPFGDLAKAPGLRVAYQGPPRPGPPGSRGWTVTIYEVVR